jgi:HB1, ASXL, restriction endonuclease HTH domain/Restriction endonuclease
MTFLEAALEILRREGRPLHYKDLTERAMVKKLLTFVGRTPEVTMQTQLTAAVKKAPGNPFVRVKPGTFGLLRYPEVAPEEAVPAEDEAQEKTEEATADGGARASASASAEATRRRRRRRGGRGRGRDDAPAAVNGATQTPALDTDSDGEGSDEPTVSGGLSAEARAAALAETGVLEADEDEASADAEDEGPMAHQDEESPDEGSGAPQGLRTPEAEAGLDARDAELDDGDEDEDEGAPAAGELAAGGEQGQLAGEEAGGRRRRRRRRRRRGEGDSFLESGSRPAGAASGGAAPLGEGAVEDLGGGLSAGAEAGPGAEEARPSGDAGPVEAGDGQGPRRIMTPVDAALEILRGQAPGRGVHVRQIADAAARRRLIHGEPNEAWRVMRTALAAEPRERLRAGVRPRVRSAGAGLFALARRPPDTELERAEHVFGEARRALRERTVAALERRIADLPGAAFEALARVLLQREGFGPATFVKRVEGTIYVEALRGRGSRPSKSLVALRPAGTSAGRRAIGELRAGIRARGQDEGLLMLGGRLADDAISEWKQPGPPIEIADGQAMAETCLRHGVGVVNAMINVDFVDADFFAELAEG